MTVRRDSVTKLLYLFRNLSAFRKIRLLLSILSNIHSNPISSFSAISAKPKSANKSGTTGGKFCFIYLSSVSYLIVFSFLMFDKLSLTEFNLKEKNKDVQKNVFIFGSPSWTRTNDTAVNSRVLYRLSYRGKFPWRIAPSKLHIKYIISHLFCKVFSLHCLSMSFHPITFKDNSRSISLRFITNLTSSVKPSTY